VRDREEKLNVISQLKRGEQFVDIWHNVRLTYDNVGTVHDNADRITEGVNSGTKVFI